MKPIAIFFHVLVVFTCASAQAQAADDTVLKALVDEMTRTTSSLHTATHPAPYFVSLTVKEIDQTNISSCLGSPAQVERSHYRILLPIVRVGSYDLDSSYPTTERKVNINAITVDDDYAAIRRTVWQSIDYSYKNAITTFEWKKAYLRGNNLGDRLADMTQEAPVVSLGPTKSLMLDEQAWSKTVQDLAAIFKKYPSVQKSKVMVTARSVNRWFVNSEGTRIRDSRPVFGITAWCSAKAPDGMPIEDYESIAAAEETPTQAFDQMKPLTENLAKRVSDLCAAPKAEEYCGPVLFEDQAAAQLISQVMAPNFGFAEEYMGSEDWTNPLKNALGRRIIAKSINIIDDPQAKQYDGVPLVGARDFDDEGVPCQKIVLVEDGKLKSFCQSRIPTRRWPHSNGHALGLHGTFSNLQLLSSGANSPEAMKQQLTDLAKDAGLDYVLVISRLAESIHFFEYPAEGSSSNKRDFATPSYSRQPTNPTVAYLLNLKDGTRHLVRGLEFNYVSLRAFRDIQAVGNDARPYLVEPPDYETRHIVVPSFVIGELELTPTKPENTSNPILPSPLESDAKPNPAN